MELDDGEVNVICEGCGEVLGTAPAETADGADIYVPAENCANCADEIATDGRSA